MAITNRLSWDDVELEADADGGWFRPDLEDFGFRYWRPLNRDQKMSVVDNFIGTKAMDRNPPPEYGFLVLPVVNPGTNNLNLSGLDSAANTVHQVEGVPEYKLDEWREKIYRLAREHFTAEERAQYFGPKV